MSFSDAAAAADRMSGSGTMRCPDGHTCINDSICVENPIDEGSYYCDCDAAVSANSKYAGLKCEHAATSYCLHPSVSDGRMSESFCTNNGICKQYTSASDGQHYGCDCPVGYAGDYCQFIEGSVPANWPTGTGFTSPYDAPKEKKENGAIAGITIAVLMILGGAALYAYRRKQKHDIAMEITSELGASAAVHSPTTSKSNDLVLDADGGVLTDALVDAGGATGGGAGMSNEDNADDDEENGMEDKEII